METVDYGDTDYRYEIEGDSKGFDKVEKNLLVNSDIRHRNLMTRAENW